MQTHISTKIHSYVGTNAASSYQSRSRLGSVYTFSLTKFLCLMGRIKQNVWGDKTCISRLFVKHCEQTDHHPAIQLHLEKLKAIEVLHCTTLQFTH